MKALKTYFEIAERLSHKLQIRSINEMLIAKKIAAVHADDHAGFDSLEDKLLENQRSVYPIFDELEAVTKDAIADAKRLGMDPMLIQRTTQSAWNYASKFQDEWFVCKAAIAIALDGCTKGEDGKQSGSTKKKNKWDSLLKFYDRHGGKQESCAREWLELNQKDKPTELECTQALKGLRNAIAERNRESKS